MSSKVAIYARVSTTNHGQDVKVQTRDLEQFAQARGWQLIDSYLDTGISGSKDSRPELNRLVLIRLTPQAPRDSVGRDAPGVSSVIARV